MFQNLSNQVIINLSSQVIINQLILGILEIASVARYTCPMFCLLSSHFHSGAVIGAVIIFAFRFCSCSILVEVR